MSIVKVKECPDCTGRVVTVLRSRDVNHGRRRLYSCARCGRRWFTIEVSEVRTDQESRAKVALEALIVALQAAIGEIKALSDDRA